MARFGSSDGPGNPDDPDYNPGNAPTQYAGYNPFEQQPAPGSADFGAPPPTPWFRRRSVLIAWFGLIAVMLAVVVWGIIQLTSRGPGDDAVTPETISSSTTSSSTTSSTTSTTTSTSESASSTTAPPEAPPQQAPTQQPPPPTEPSHHHHLPSLPSVITIPPVPKVPELPTVITLPPHH